MDNLFFFKTGTYSCIIYMALALLTLSSMSRSNLWESIAEEVNSADLVALVEDAIDM